MRLPPRPDDFATRRAHLAGLSDQELQQRFWRLTEQIVAPLVERARTRTSPSIERSVLLRMGFSSGESKALVDAMQDRGLLGRGAGRLVLELSQGLGVAPREAGVALIEGRHWDELSR